MTGTVDSCTCDVCVSCCETAPGWMTPEEAEKAMDAKMAMFLMKDWYVNSDEHDTYVLCPACKGHEGDFAPTDDEIFGSSFMSRLLSNPTKMPCVLLTDGRCTIHDSGFKPEQCRTTLACDDNSFKGYTTKKSIAAQWSTPKGLEILERWNKETTSS